MLTMGGAGRGPGTGMKVGQEKIGNVGRLSKTIMGRSKYETLSYQSLCRSNTEEL